MKSEAEQALAPPLSPRRKNFEASGPPNRSPLSVLPLSPRTAGLVAVRVPSRPARPNISPAPSGFVAPAHSTAPPRPATARVRENSHPFLSRRIPAARVNGDDDALAAERLRRLGHQLGAFDRRRVERNFVGARPQHGANVLQVVEAAADSERNEDMIGDATHQIGDDGALIRRRRVRETLTRPPLGVVPTSLVAVSPASPRRKRMPLTTPLRSHRGG